MNEFDQELYEEILELNPSTAKKYLSKYPKEIQKAKLQIWPLKNKWFHNKKFDLIKKRFKFLEPMFIQIGNIKFRLSYNESSKLLSNKPYDFQQRHMICVNGIYRIPTFMKQNCKVGIAKRVGCSVRTIETYF